jgi:hypothetical protein
LSDQSPKSPAGALQVFIDIVRMRRGPEDLPFDRSLLLVTVVAYGLLNFGIGLLLPHTASPLLPVLIDIAVTVGSLHWLLRLARKPERFVQSATAMFGFQIVLAPAMLFVAWLSVRYAQDATWQLPVAVLLFGVVMWALVVAARILRSATGWPMAACVAATITIDLFARLIVLSLFPQALTAPASP